MASDHILGEELDDGSHTFREIAPFERIRYIDKFDAPNLPGEPLMTVNLKPVPGPWNSGRIRRPTIAGDFTN